MKVEFTHNVDWQFVTPCIVIDWKNKTKSIIIGFLFWALEVTF